MNSINAKAVLNARKGCIKKSAHLVGTEHDAHGCSSGVLGVAQGGFNRHFHGAVRGRKEMQVLRCVHTTCARTIIEGE